MLTKGNVKVKDCNWLRGEMDEEVEVVNSGSVLRTFPCGDIGILLLKRLIVRCTGWFVAVVCVTCQVRMFQSLLGSYARIRVKVEHALQKVNGCGLIRCIIEVR